MSYSNSPNDSVLRHELNDPGALGEMGELIQKSTLEITVLGVEPTQEIFIQSALSHQHNLTFLSFKSLRGTIRYGTFSGQDLLLFLVSAERSHALRQVRIMKWIMNRQPSLTLIPLIPSKAVWEAMRESLANDFPIYLPINFQSLNDGSFSSRFRDATLHHFPQIFEALGGSAADSEATAKQLHKLSEQMHLQVAELRMQVLQLERKLTLADKHLRVQTPAASRVFQRSGTTMQEWRSDRYLMA